MKILGIDPGSRRIGFGLIKSRPKLQLIHYGTLEVKNSLELAEKYQQLLQDLKPALVAIEKIYFAKNSKTALAVAECKGILQFLTQNSGLPIVEYGPTEIKKTVSGYGLADKKAVAKVAALLLGLKKLEEFDDASDALAIALTAALSYPPANS